MDFARQSHKPHRLFPTPSILVALLHRLATSSPLCFTFVSFVSCACASRPAFCVPTCFLSLRRYVLRFASLSTCCVVVWSPCASSAQPACRRALPYSGTRLPVVRQDIADNTLRKITARTSLTLGKCHARKRSDSYGKSMVCRLCLGGYQSKSVSDVLAVICQRCLGVSQLPSSWPLPLRVPSRFRRDPALSSRSFRAPRPPRAPAFRVGAALF